MKATGIVRRIDDLGRVVVPKEIRKTLRLREGDAAGAVIITSREQGKKFREVEFKLAETAALFLGKQIES